MTESSDVHWPTEIRCSADKKFLSVTFAEDTTFTIAAELLRGESPSAEVQGHSVYQKKTPLDKQDVQIIGIEPVGSYAVRLVFSDGHDTGIYSWELLHDFGMRQEEIMADYRARIAQLI